MLRVVIWDFKRADGGSHADGKTNFDKQMFVGPCRDNGTQRGTLTNRLFLVPVYTLFHTIIIYGDGFLPETGPLFTL